MSNDSMLADREHAAGSTHFSSEHRENILNAAIEVFARDGYAAASTNDIVKRAKVSKGLLFHHFTNKKNLYTACQLYVLERYGEFMSKYVDLSSADFFDRILCNMRTKIEFGRRHPQYLALISRAWYVDGEENPLDRRSAEEYIVTNMQVGQLQNFFTGVDTTCFREGFDVSKLFNYTRLITEAIWQRFSASLNNDPDLMASELDNYLAESEEILTLLKHGAYSGAEAE